MAIGSDSGLGRGFVAPPSTRSVRILKLTGINGVFVKAGEVVEVTETDARLLVGNSHAEYYEAPPKKRNVKKTPKNRMVSEDEMEDRDLSE